MTCLNCDELCSELHKAQLELLSYEKVIKVLQEEIKILELRLYPDCISQSEDTAQYRYCKFSSTDTCVAAVHASGFTFSVHPRLHVFHETPTIQTHPQCITQPVAHL